MRNKVLFLKMAALMLCLILAGSLCSCAVSQPEVPEAEVSLGPTWQEQYDLGVRYLSEGNYREAIIAFTAAIEIDPKQAPAYVGRGDAYVLFGETEENLSAARMDYEKAIELDETSAEAYLGLADVYIRQGDYEAALEVLEQGLEKVENDQSITDKIAEVQEILKIETGKIILFSQYNIDDFISEEEFTIGGTPFFELTIEEAANYLPKFDYSAITASDDGLQSYWVSKHIDDSTSYAIIACDQYGDSPKINHVQYGGYYDRHIIETVKTEIRGISIGDSMETVLEQIGIPVALAERLIRTGASISIGANHNIQGGYGWLMVEENGSSISDEEAQTISILAARCTCTMYFIKNQLVLLVLQVQ